MSKNNKVNSVCNESFSYYTIDKQIECELCKTKLALSFKQNNKVYNLLDFLKSNYKQYMILECIQTSSDKRKKPNIRCFYTVNLYKKNEISIGRSGDADVKFNDISISRIHCFFKIKEKDIYVKDNSSKFGTLIHFNPKSFAFDQRSYFVLQIGRTFHSFKHEINYNIFNCLFNCFKCEKKEKNEFQPEYYFTVNKKNLKSIIDGECEKNNCPDIHFSVVTDIDDEINIQEKNIEINEFKDDKKLMKVNNLDNANSFRKKIKNSNSSKQVRNSFYKYEDDFIGKKESIRKSNSFILNKNNSSTNVLIEKNPNIICLEDVNVNINNIDENFQDSKSKNLQSISKEKKALVTLKNKKVKELESIDKKFKTISYDYDIEVENYENLNNKENEVYNNLMKSCRNRNNKKDKIKIKKDEILLENQEYNPEYLKKLKVKNSKKKTLGEKLQQSIKSNKDNEFKKIEKNAKENTKRLATSIDNKIFKNVIKRSLMDKGFKEKYIDDIIENVGKKRNQESPAACNNLNYINNRNAKSNKNDKIKYSSSQEIYDLNLKFNNMKKAYEEENNLNNDKKTDKLKSFNNLLNKNFVEKEDKDNDIIQNNNNIKSNNYKSKNMNKNGKFINMRNDI